MPNYFPPRWNIAILASISLTRGGAASGIGGGAVLYARGTDGDDVVGVGVVDVVGVVVGGGVAVGFSSTCLATTGEEEGETEGGKEGLPITVKARGGNAALGFSFSASASALTGTGGLSTFGEGAAS